MKEGLLNHLVTDRGPEGECATADTVIPAEETREHTEAQLGERTEQLMKGPTESLTKERTTLTKERAESLTKERAESLTKERTDSLMGEETEDSLDNGVEGTSEGSVQPESKAPSVGADLDEHLPAASSGLGDPAAQTQAPDGGGLQEPPEDWLEPLEEDDVDEEEDAQSWELDLAPRVNGSREVEEESLAGESEKSGSMVGSDRNSFRQGGQSDQVFRRRRRRKQSTVDEEWEDWPALGEGWKRKEVFRRSGFSMGKTDTYYMSPQGDRLRSRVELAKNLAGTLDISTFDFKSGRFLDEASFRKRRKLKKVRKMPSSAGKRQSSLNFGGAPHKPRTVQPKSSLSPQRSTGRPSSITTTPPRPITTTPRPTPPHLHGPAPSLSPIGLSSTPHSPRGQRLRPVLKQEAESPDWTQPELPAPGCLSCGGPIAGVGPWKKRQSSLCQKCQGKRKDDSPIIIPRKWLPCGHCRACLLTENCGMCASCRKGQLNHGNYRPVRCRKRKCLCPIRKKTAKEKLAEAAKLAEKAEKELAKLDKQHMAPEVQKVTPFFNNKKSESEFVVCIDGEGEGEDEAADEDDFLSSLGRPCGSCNACLRSTDCGYCDACADRLRLSALGKARRPCRLRRCRRPSEYVQHILHEGWMGLGSPRPHYGSGSRWGKRKKAFWDDLEFSEDEDDEENIGAETPGDRKQQQEADKDAGIWTSKNCLKADSGKSDLVKANKCSAGVPRSSLSGAGAVSAGGPAGGQGEGEGWGRIDGSLLDGGLDTRETAEKDEGPMISSIFSLADGAQADGEALLSEGAGVPLEPELQSLLDALRRMALPPYWVGLLAEGPSLQLVQCSRRSTMADTCLSIDSGFYYQISVQGQPLHLTHTLYKDHPRKLPTVAHVVALLLDLERYAVCQGFPAPGHAPRASRQPFLPTRAAVCPFLVLKTEERCGRCRGGPQGP